MAEKIKSVAENEIPASDPGEEYVEVFIQQDFRVSGDDRISLVVNGEKCVVKPGNKVKIKRKFAEAYKEALQAQSVESAYINKISSDGYNLAE